MNLLEFVIFFWGDLIGINKLVSKCKDKVIKFGKFFCRKVYVWDGYNGNWK